MFKRNAMGNTRAKLLAGAVLLTLGMSAAGAAMSTDVFGGGATLPAGGYVGWGFTPSQIFSANVASPSQAAAAIDSGSLLGHWSSTTGHKLAYCQTGSGNGKKIFDHFDGTNVLPGATAACTGIIPGGFGANASVVDPHFAGSDAPMSQQEFTWFVSNGGKAALNKQPVQLPSIVGAVALAYNNPDVPASQTLNLSDTAVCKIFSGTVSNWQDLTTAETGLTSVLPSRALDVVYRQDGSGTSFSFANHLSTVCGSVTGATNTFLTDQAFSKVVSKFAATPTDPTNAALVVNSQWFPATGNPGVVTKIDATAGSIGYAEAANLAHTTVPNTRVSNVNGFNPYTNLPASFTFLTVLVDNVINGVNADGTPHVQTLSPVAPQAGCMVMVSPANYANIAGQYPIVAVSNLIYNAAGNGSDLAAVRSMASSVFGTSHAGVTLVGTGTGYAFVNAPTAASKVNTCIN